MRHAEVLLRHDPAGAIRSLRRARRSNIVEFVASWTQVEPAQTDPVSVVESRLVLEQLGVPSAQPCQGFNVQPNGQSGMWIRCRNASEQTVVVFDGVPLETTFENPSLVTAPVPRELYAAEGRYPVYLLN